MRCYKVILLICLLVNVFNIGYAEKMGVLSSTAKPDNITIHGNELYIVEGAEIFIYSLKDLKLVRKFGKRGEGPGEMLVIPNRYYNCLHVTDDAIYAESYNKLIIFNKDGSVRQEIKKPNIFIRKTLPVGKNFVVVRGIIDQEKKVIYSAVLICDGQLKELKELYRQEFVQQGLQPPVRIQMVMDFTNIDVDGDKIFIDKSPNGFLIDVYDSQGTLLYSIKKNDPRLPVTSSDKEKMLARFKDDPSIKEQSKQAGGYAVIEKFFNLEYNDVYPSIRRIRVNGGKLYVQTFQVKDGKDLYWIMDTKGKNEKQTWTPGFSNIPLTAELLGATLDTIYNGKLYYLQENIDDEEWELHAEMIE